MQATVPNFTTNNITLLLLRDFMDELNLISFTVYVAQMLVSWGITTLTWAGVEFRVKNCNLLLLSEIDL